MDLKILALSKRYADKIANDKVNKADIVNDVTVGGEDKIASAETVKLLNHMVNVVASPAAKKYGVTGVGGASTALTRIWDNIGMTAQVGTDETNASYLNNFDNIAPFNRVKCVGSWSAGNGKAVFTPQAYYGDPDYSEDGSMGDYVAVEIEPFYYYQDDFSQTNPSIIAGTIGVTACETPGWKIHPVCVDASGVVREKTYLPCYSLALKDGKAISLPGYHNEFGGYKVLWDKTRTYNNEAFPYAELEPAVVRHYEWLLFTIEFATTNCQSVMGGATAMPYTATDVIALAASNTNSVVVTAAIGNKYVIGQTIYIGATYSATPSNFTEYNVITNIEECDADGALIAAGTYRKITFSGNSRTVTTTTTISSRPWITGSCNTVKTPSGVPCSPSLTSLTPVTATSYPMRYRYRENIWGNQYSTCVDLMCKLEGAGTVENPYYIEWYYMTDRSYYPSTTSKPDATDFDAGKWTKLPQKTDHADGYIKRIAMSKEYPYIITPIVQTGASVSTYYSDYAYFVNGTQSIRAVRFGGALASGSPYGVLSFVAHVAPSAANWYYGGGLYFTQ